MTEKAAESAEQVSKEKINIENAATEDVPEEITADVEVAEVVTRSPLLLPVEVRDEVCDDEQYYDVVDPAIAFTCLQCKLEHFPVNYKDGDTVKKWSICIWHLGVSKCRKCGKKLIGMDQIRAHRQICYQEEITK